jgi:CheY-like chemotaxis protein
MDDKMYTTLFYADDDIDDLDFFKEVAGEINKPVSLFEQGDKLLETLHNPPPKASVIFLDLNMPVKSGFEVLKEIRSSPVVNTIPVIILSTSTNPADIELCKNLGANLYIRKPTNVGGLRKAINYVLSVDWNNFIVSDKDFVYQH